MDVKAQIYIFKKKNIVFSLLQQNVQQYLCFFLQRDKCVFGDLFKLVLPWNISVGSSVLAVQTLPFLLFCILCFMNHHVNSFLIVVIKGKFNSLNENVFFIFKIKLSFTFLIYSNPNYIFQGPEIFQIWQCQFSYLNILFKTIKIKDYKAQGNGVFLNKCKRTWS